MNNTVCPISTQKIDRNVSRLTAITSVLIIAVAMYFNCFLLLAFATFDYFMRSFLKFPDSPLVFIIKTIVKPLKIEPIFIDKAPKVFAARLGFSFGILAVIFFFINIPTSYTFAGILALCSLLDASINFCIGCVIYHNLVLPFYKK